MKKKCPRIRPALSRSIIQRTEEQGARMDLSSLVELRGRRRIAETSVDVQMLAKIAARLGSGTSLNYVTTKKKWKGRV